MTATELKAMIEYHLELSKNFEGFWDDDVCEYLSWYYRRLDAK